MAPLLGVEDWYKPVKKVLKRMLRVWLAGMTQLVRRKIYQTLISNKKTKIR